MRKEIKARERQLDYEVEYNNRQRVPEHGEINARWQSAGVSCQYLEVPGANHFTVVDELVSPDSALSIKLAQCARA